MATAYKTPGVYVEEISTFPPSVAQVETAVPAFIGYTEKAIKNGDDITLKPTRITSLLEYLRYFGASRLEEGIVVTIRDQVESRKAGTETLDTLVSREVKARLKTAQPYTLYYALQMFYNNGGGPCYIVSVESYGGKENPPVIAKDDLIKGIEALEKMDEPTLLIVPEAVKLGTAKDCFEVQQKCLDQAQKLGDRFAVLDIIRKNADWNDDVKAFRDKVAGDLLKAQYGAAYFPNLLTNISFEYDENKTDLEHKVDKTNIAEDGTVTEDNGKAGSLNTKTLGELAAENNALYNQCKAAIDDLDYEMAPSAAMAGLYAYVDRTRGVWKAPANVQVNTVNDLTETITNVDQDGLNVDANSGKSVNVIRFFTGKGILVWGARTLAGNDNEWRYVSVRRFFNMVEESCKKASAQFVFEPNDANTWTKVRAMIENFLTVLWRQGALAGAKPEHAFYVKCGLGQTMTALDILEGRMIVEIGMAAVRPAEFIILRFSHKMQES
jgi:hypothetical protein